MKERLFKEKFDEIEIPKDDVNEAIRNGIQKANDSHPNRRKVLSRTRNFIISSAAAVTLLLSSFVVPSVSHVMAEVPVVGQVYSNFNDLVGKNLASQQLITQLNETASYEGINVTVTSAYYDGAAIGVTFDVTGDVSEDQSNQVSAFYEIFNGDKTVSDSQEIVHMKQTDSGYTGQIQLNYPENQLPDDTTFPLEFKRIGEKEGVWKFDVPIKQLPHDVLNVDKESVGQEGDIRVHFDSITAGKASTAINYTATFPATGKNNQVALEAYDDQGNRIRISTDGIDLEKTQENDQIIVKGRSIIEHDLKGETTYIKIHPKVALTGKNPNNPLELEPIKINLNK